MANVILPITPGMNQDFTCTLPVGDKNITLGFTLTFNEPGGYWFMSISDHDTGITLISALPLLPGEFPAANLLSQHDYLNIGSVFLLSVTNENSMPTLDSLGKEHIVVWSDNLL